MANAHDLFDLLATLFPPISAKVSQNYVGACAVLEILKFSNSISQIFIDEKNHSIETLFQNCFLQIGTNGASRN